MKFFIGCTQESYTNDIRKPWSSVSSNPNISREGSYMTFYNILGLDIHLVTKAEAPEVQPICLVYFDMCHKKATANDLFDTAKDVLAKSLTGNELMTLLNFVSERAYNNGKIDKTDEIKAVLGITK